jgi:hypothetical protein
MCSCPTSHLRKFSTMSFVVSSPLHSPIRLWPETCWDAVNLFLTTLYLPPRRHGLIRAPSDAKIRRPSCRKRGTTRPPDLLAILMLERIVKLESLCVHCKMLVETNMVTQLPMPSLATIGRPCTSG